ncbi:DUF4335 domain-containing protein [Prochlorococcus sp. AH-716-E13]|nr:DUF4335 domain-containing protein [Prochlorococcus sp. AH-716-E13]
MFQNKFLFNQSSVSLEIIGLPDYSNNENKDYISIISQWKLMIIDKPVIEGNLEHLKSIMKAFYSYSISLLNDENPRYESNLIDITSENFYTHILLLKSSKPKVKPLNIRIGNSVLADTINCFDQLGSSNKVKNIYQKGKLSKNKKPSNFKNKNYLSLLDKKNIFNFLLPPLFSLCSIFLVSTALIYVYDGNDNSSLINTKNKLISIKSSNKLL